MKHQRSNTVKSTQLLRGTSTKKKGPNKTSKTMTKTDSNSHVNDSKPAKSSESTTKNEVAKGLLVPQKLEKGLQI